MEQTFNIPEGCKRVTFKQDGDKIITIFDPVFQKGDIITNNIFGNICILDFVGLPYGDTVNYICAYVLREKIIIKNDFGCGSIRDFSHSTDSEKQQLFDALAKEGKRWNPETMQIEDLKVEPKVGDYVKAKYGVSMFFIGVYKGGLSTTNRVSNDGVLSGGIFWNYDSIEVLSVEQFQSELNALGFEYNFDNDTISELKWKPKDRDMVYIIGFYNAKFKPIRIEFHFEISSHVNALGENRIYKTNTECEAAISKIKKALS